MTNSDTNAQLCFANSWWVFWYLCESPHEYLPKQQHRNTNV